MRTRITLILAPVALLLPVIIAISPEARRIETTFTFILASQPLTNVTSAVCPGVIDHRSIRRYRGIDPSNSSRELDGILWRDLSVNGINCLSSIRPQAATRFLPASSDPPDTPADIANPWFIRGVDNSPRRCGPFAPSYPGLYYFTDDLPRFKQRFSDTGIIPRDTVLPDVVQNPRRGDIFMISQQYDPLSGGAVALNVICMYVVGTVTSTMSSPQPSPGMDEGDGDDGGDDGGSVCFPGYSRVRKEGGGMVSMRDLRIGDRVLVGWNGGVEVYSAVISFSHKDAWTATRYARIWVSRGTCGEGVEMVGNMTKLTATRGHLVRMGDGGLEAIGRLKVGALVKVGGCEGRGPGSLGRVERVEGVWGNGVYSPVTLHGDIVVEGVVASSYTTSVRMGAAHGLLTPVRWGFRVLTGIGVEGVEWCGVIDLLRWLCR